MPQTLQRTHILLTRPQHQVSGLVAALTQVGASVLVFPTLTIHAIEDPESLNSSLQALDTFDWFLFVSPNAVQHALPLIQTHHALENLTAQWGAVGAGTTDELKKFDVHNALYPTHGVGAQALLDVLDEHLLNHKKVAVFKGDSENQILEDGLKARGAQVTDIICYERKRATDDPTPLVHAIQNDHIQAIVSTSGDGLKALVDLAPETLQSKLTDIPLMVVSDRIHGIAETLGFQHIFQAQNASDEAIVDCVLAWHSQRSPS